MAILQYTVWGYANEVAQGDVIQEGTITIAAVSAQGAAILAPSGVDSKHRCRVRISADAACWVTWGSNPTALTDGTEGRMMGTGASVCEYFDIQAGDKIAAISRS